MIDISRMIAEARKSRGYTQDTLADKIGVTKQTISNYERGLRRPDYETLEAISDALNCPMEYFLTSEEIKESLHSQSNPSVDEPELVRIFRSLNDEGRSQLLIFARGLSATACFKPSKKAQ